MDCFCRQVNKLAASGPTSLTRAVQTLNEKFSSVERTQLDVSTKDLLSRAEEVSIWTKMIAASTQTLLDDYIIYDKQRVKQKSSHLNHLSRLGSTTAGAARVFASLTIDESWKILDRFGWTQHRIADAEFEFALEAEKVFLIPLKKFIEADLKMLVRDKKLLECRRKDLDFFKAVYGSNSTSVKQRLDEDNRGSKINIVSRDSSSNSQERLARAQELYDKQIGVTKATCYRILGAVRLHANHLAKVDEIQANNRQKSVMNKQSDIKELEHADQVGDCLPPAGNTEKGGESKESEQPPKAEEEQSKPNPESDESSSSDSSDQSGWLEGTSGICKLFTIVHKNRLYDELRLTGATDFESTELGVAEKIWTSELRAEKTKILKKISNLYSTWPEKLIKTLDLVIDLEHDDELRRFYLELTAEIAKNNQQFCTTLISELSKRLSQDIYDRETIDSLRAVDKMLDLQYREHVCHNMRKARGRYFGTIKIFGELYNIGLISVRNVLGLMGQLMCLCGATNKSYTQSENFEALCRLLQIVGSKFYKHEEEHWVEFYDEYLAYVGEYRKLHAQVPAFENIVYSGTRAEFKQ